MRSPKIPLNLIRAIPCVLVLALFAPPALAGCNEWTTNGPSDAGQLMCLAADPLTPGTLYAGSYFGSDHAIFKSVDGGARWEAMDHGIPSGAEMRTLVIDPVDSATVWAGGAGPNIGGPRIWKTTDGGATWVDCSSGLSGPGFNTIVSLAVDPCNRLTLYAGDAAEVFKSTDGGNSWAPSSQGIPWNAIDAIAVNPKTPTTLYAAVYGMDDAGIYKSTDGGGSWNLCYYDCVTGITYGYDVILDPTKPDTVYAGVSCGVIKSTDGGVTWNRIADHNHMGFIALDPSNPAILYISRGVESYKSTDGGATWQPLAFLDYTQAFLVDPHDPASLHAVVGLLDGRVFSLTQAPWFPGDCNGDGQISIGELQKAINMFVWGTTPVCGVDRDGDGAVSIGEVQTVINGFLGLEDACSLTAGHL